MEKSLESFAQDLYQEIITDSVLHDAQDFKENVFTRKVMEMLAEAGDINDGEVCYHQARGLKINGYVADYDEDRLDLFVSIFQENPSVSRVEKARVLTALKQVRTFIQTCFNNYYLKVDESSDVFALAHLIHSLSSHESPLSRIRVFLITNGLVRVEDVGEEQIGRFRVLHSIRDIEWLYNWSSSGKTPDVINIDLTATPTGALPCLEMPISNGEYRTFLALVPAAWLYDIYSEYGGRLLERNVRSFLQAKGGVNRGIRRTLAEMPHRFLAYNNGLTATAEFVQLSADGSTIEQIKDLQIVNGGQTTASIFHAKRRDNVDISNVYVQMKLSVVQDLSRLDEFVAAIALYANSQNKVNIADFSSNSPFHRRIEEYSRNVWAPAKAGVQHHTKWFYERARGQYADSRNREGSKAKAWEKQNPPNQMFSKTDLAKFENSWMQKPHIVSRGAQKNFSEFTDELGKRTGFEPDQTYFEHLIAKAIFFKTTEKIVSAQRFGGYRANIVTYTMAYLSYVTQQRLDLDTIWRNQGISEDLEESIRLVAEQVNRAITNPPGGRNVTEWCKHDRCWAQIKEMTVTLPDGLSSGLVKYGRGAGSNRSVATPTAAEVEVIAKVAAHPGDMWLALSSWAKATDNLAGWQRRIVFSVGGLLKRGNEPSHKQAKYAWEALLQAQEKGFDPSRL